VLTNAKKREPYTQRLILEQRASLAAAVNTTLNLEEGGTMKKALLILGFVALAIWVGSLISCGEDDSASTAVATGSSFVQTDSVELISPQNGLDNSISSIIRNPAQSKTFFLEDENGNLVSKVFVYASLKTKNFKEFVANLSTSMTASYGNGSPEEISELDFEDASQDMIQYDQENEIVIILRPPAKSEKSTCGWSTITYNMSYVISGLGTLSAQMVSDMIVLSAAPTKQSLATPYLKLWTSSNTSCSFPYAPYEHTASGGMWTLYSRGGNDCSGRCFKYEIKNTSTAAGYIGYSVIRFNSN
jgi:hypothetical protein